MLVNELAERDGHLLLDGRGVVDVARDTEKLGTSVALTAERAEPASAAAKNGGCDGDGFDVGDSGGAAEDTDGSGEWRLQAGLAGLALEGFNERSLLTANVGAHTAVDVNVEVVAGAASVLADETGLVCLLDSALEDSSLVVELATDVDVRGGALMKRVLAAGNICLSASLSTYVHGASGDQTALNELVGILPHNLTVLAGTRLTLVGVDDQVSGGVALLPTLGVHEGPLHATGETSTTTTTKTRGLDLRNDPVISLENHLLSLVPVTVLHRALQVGAVVAVQVREDAVLVLQTARVVNRRRVLDGGHAALLLAILSGSSLLRCGGGKRADCALVERGANVGGGAEGGLCRGGKHCDGGQCWCLSGICVRLRRLE